MTKQILPSLLTLLTLGAALLLFLAMGSGQLDSAGLAADILQATKIQALLGSEREYGLESIDLAVSGVSLRQGAAGTENWILDAQYATLRQDLGLLDVRSPLVRYSMFGPDGMAAGQLTASSQSGSVDSLNNLMTMTGDVLANYRAETVSSPLAVYHSQRHLLEFSGGVALRGPGLSGRAQTVSWDLAANVLRAEQDVTMIWIPD